jgi:hypothetical protein
MPLLNINGHVLRLLFMRSLKTSYLEHRPTPKVFYTCFYNVFYNHARRPRLEKLLYIEPPRSSSGHFKPLLDPGGRFISDTAARRF